MISFYRYLMEHYTATLLLVGLAIVLGLFGLGQLPVSYYPDFSVPAAIIITAYPGAGPEAVEEEVTRPLEESVSTLSGIDRIESVSQEGFSRITLSFSFGVDVEAKKREVQERIDLVRSRLPRESMAPSLTTINQLLPPPVQLAVTSSRRSLGELTLLARDRIAPALSRLSGVAVAQVAGGTELIVAVEVDPRRLRETSLGWGQLAAALSANNLDFPLGDIQGNDFSFSLRLNGRLGSLTEIENLPLALPAGKIVKLGDIARVSLREKRSQSFARIDGRPSVGILVRQPSGGNSVLVADQVRAWLKRESSKLPQDVGIKIVKDESLSIRRAITQVALSGLLGGLLASLLIYLFLGRLANIMVIVVSIPATVIITFAAMRIFRLSLNTVSIGGLSLSVGLVVDAAVVVLENIFRHLGGNETPGVRRDKIARATSEVGLAVSAATLTTVVVFLPLAFTAGFAKVLLGELALTVAFALLISIVMSSTLVPVLSFFWVETGRKASGLSRRFLNLMDRVRTVYLKLLGWLLAHRVAGLSAFLAMLLLGLGLLRIVDTGLLDSSDQGEFQLSLSYPRGTALEHTDRNVRQLERQLLRLDGVAKIFSLVGQDPFFGTPQPYLAVINIYTAKGANLRKVMEQVRGLAESLPGAEISLRIIDATAGIQRNDIEVNIFGDDLDTLRELGERLRRDLASQPEFRDLESNLAQGWPSYVLVPERQTLAAVGLDVRSLSQAIRSAKAGFQVSRVRWRGSEIDLEISQIEAQKLTRREIENIPIATPRAGQLPLKALGRFYEGRSPAQIVRLDQSRTVNVTGYFSGLVSARRSREKLARVLKDFPLPPGYRAELRGANRAIVESFRTLGLALLMALLLVYIVLGVQFNSLSLPLVILSTVPFSLPGYVGALVITGDQLNLSSFLAGIMISGIVVNNSILMLDFVIARRRNGQERQQAILSAAVARFRPVMMTSLTTILGALFLALDIGGGQALRALARAYIGGLSYGLLVSLLLVPVVYTLMDDLLCRLGRKCLPNKIAD